MPSWKKFRPGEPLDVVSRFAEPLAVGSILAHLGIPQSDFGLFRNWSLALMRARAEGSGCPGRGRSRHARTGRNVRVPRGRSPNKRRRSDDSDVLSVLMAACDDESMRPEEMMMMLIHISLAGNGPTSMAMGNAIAALAGDPGAQASLRESPETIAPAVEELLRFDSSTHFVARWAKADVKLGTRSVRTGQQLHVMVGAANRDPERFSEPDTLQLDRTR